MMIKLRVKNFILTEELSLDFSEGLNVLTGETGAGKSVIVGSLDYILGKQVRADLFYDKSKPVYLEAEFGLAEMRKYQNNLLDVLGFDACAAGKSLIISKEITVKGKPISFVNGNRINQKQVYELRETLVDFHSQRDQLRLFDEEYQLEILDQWSGLSDLREQYSNLFHRLKRLMDKKKQMEHEEKRSVEKNRLYEYQIAELAKMELSVDEEKEINSELDILNNAEEILSICAQMQQIFIEQDNSFLDIISSYRQSLQKMGQGNQTVNSIVSYLTSMTQQINDLHSETRNLEEDIELDENRKTILEDRITEIIKIKNKYNKDIPQLIEFLEQMKKEVEATGSRKEEIKIIAGEIESGTTQLCKLAEQLTEYRRRGAASLSAEIMTDFADLSIPDGIFSVDITPTGKIYIDNDIIRGLNETGQDRVDFLFSANKGQAPSSLRSVVSGGELSRLLLIIKKKLAVRIGNPTLVLDEIDTGIGGKTASSIGQYISQIAGYHQVICITHLPQIACFAESQFFIEKKTKNDIPLITVKRLSQQERREEIARMLSGTKSDIALRHADEILNNN